MSKCRFTTSAFLFLLIVFSLISSACKRETPFLGVWGGWAEDSGTDIMQSKDGYLVLGSSRSDSSGQQIVLLMIDNVGEIISSYSYGGGLDDTAIGITNLGDKSAILGVGYTPSSSLSYWLACVDDNGIVVWDDSISCSGHCFNGAITSDNRFLYTALQSDNSCIDIAQYSHDGTRLWSILLDKQGSELLAKDITVLPSGDVVLLVNELKEQGLGILLYTISSQGSIISVLDYSSSDILEIGVAVAYMNGNSYLITNRFESTLLIKAILYKLNPDGVIEWERSYGTSGFTNAVSVTTQQKENQLIILTTTDSQRPSSDIRIAAVDGLDGEELWNSVIGGDREEVASAIITTREHGFAFVGSTESYSDGVLPDILFGRLGAFGDRSTLEYPSTRIRDTEVFVESYNVVDSSIVDEYGNSLYVASVRRTRDMGYLVEYGLANSSSCFLLKVSATGDSLWTSELEEKFSGWYPLLLLETSDGGFTLFSGSLGVDNVTKYSADFVELWSSEIDYLPNVISITEVDDGYIVVGQPYRWQLENNRQWIDQYGFDENVMNIYIAKYNYSMEQVWFSSYPLPRLSGGYTWRPGFADGVRNSFFIEFDDMYVVLYGMWKERNYDITSGVWEVKTVALAVADDGRTLWTREYPLGRQGWRCLHTAHRVLDYVVMIERCHFFSSSIRDKWTITLLDDNGTVIAESEFAQPELLGVEKNNLFSTSDGIYNVCYGSMYDDNLPTIYCYDFEGLLTGQIPHSVPGLTNGYKCHEALLDSFGHLEGIILAGEGGEVVTQTVTEEESEWEQLEIPIPRLFVVRTNPDGSV